jgi:Cu2+-containing amine oxidase
MQTESESATVVAHPLEPLSAAEIEEASDVLRQDLAPTVQRVGFG